MLRLVTLNSDNTISIDGSNVSTPMTAKDRAIQRFFIALLTTPGTRVDDPGYGGGLRDLFFSKRLKTLDETKSYIAKKIAATENSLLRYEPDEDFAITGVILEDVVRKSRGLSLFIRLEFQGAFAEKISLREEDVII